MASPADSRILFSPNINSLRAWPRVWRASNTRVRNQHWSVSRGGWQIGYLLEPLANGWVTVFLPQAPTPMSGNNSWVGSGENKSIAPGQLGSVLGPDIIKTLSQRSYGL